MERPQALEPGHQREGGKAVLRSHEGADRGVEGDLQLQTLPVKRIP